MSLSNEKIFELLPAVYRVRDIESGGPLKALIDVIAEQAELAEKDIAQLYKNWFIETCDEWVVPYIGDLLGVRSFHTVADASALSQRSYVANTLSYRRRKGIAPVLEQLALDVTGWRAHVVEFFQLLSTTQFMNHIRLQRTVTPDLRQMNQLDLLNTPFDTIAHTADVRHIASGRGRYNIPDIGLFIWRLQSYPVTLSDARIQACPASPPSSTGNYFTFDPLGNNTQLFNKPVTETTITHISEEVNVPALLRRRALFDELDNRRQALVNGDDFQYIYFDDRLENEDDPDTQKHPVFEIYPNDSAAPVPPEEILICNLDQCCTPPADVTYKKLMPDNSYADVKMPITVAVDPVLGRFAFTDSSIQKARVSYSYGFSGDIGAGTYNRQASVLDFLNKDEIWQVGVSQRFSAVGDETIFVTIGEAVAAWNALPTGSNGIITIMDSCSYLEDVIIKIPENSQLLIVAAQWPERDDPDPTVSQKWRKPGDIAATELRPHLQGNISVLGDLADKDQKTGGAISINGMLLEGKMNIKEGNLGAFTVEYCTLAPDNGGLEAKASDEASNQWMEASIKSSICGPVNLFQTAASSLLIEDCIIDHSADWALQATEVPVQLTRSTFLGMTQAKTINAENCIFNATLKAERRQEGCIRFSYLPGKNPQAPRRFRCQPELEVSTEIAEQEKLSGPLTAAQKAKLTDNIYQWLMPGFTSLKFGHHAYAQLAFSCPEQISAGADNGSEMGVFCFLQQPQRQANLRIALDEYLPFGLEAGVIYVT